MELYLNFTNEDGEDERIAVKREKFFIGRHSENDLCIPNPKLSREHIQIERLSDTFGSVGLQVKQWHKIKRR